MRRAMHAEPVAPAPSISIIFAIVKIRRKEERGKTHVRDGGLSVPTVTFLRERGIGIAVFSYCAVTDGFWQQSAFRT